MYRRLLVPIEQPADVEPLLRFAAQLLDADGEIRVLHVIPTRSLPEVTRRWRASVNIVVPAHETGAALDIRVDPEVRSAADVAGEILDSAETHHVDGILMTLRGSARRTRSIFVGHTASSVLHHAAVDVLIVNRLALVEKKVPRILVPTFSSTPSAKALKAAEEIALYGHGTPIVTLALGARDGAVPEPATRSPRGLPIHHKHSAFSEAILGHRHRLPELILQAAARLRYGLLLVGEESIRGEGPLLTRRFLEELFRRAPCPVVAIRG
ncbi:MAG: universal stress protein [Thermoplasmata archaeon]|nr:universal stress protein [Thermoplasmata archaeon]